MPQSVEGHDLASYSLPKKHYQSHNPTHGPELRKIIQNYSFQLNDKIGRGYSSTVFRGTNDLTHQIVAIKVVQLRSLKDETSRSMLHSQIACLRELKHGNILRFHDSFFTANNCYLVTQYCLNGDLARMLRSRGSFSEEEARNIFLQVYRGYSQVNQAGYVHRDLKPANMFIDDKMQVKIADFGFVKKMTGVEKETYNVGTPIYMAPESLFYNVYNEKTDVWALGVTLYQLVFGETPFHGRSELELKRAVDLAFVTFKPECPISTDMKDFILKCLCKDPSERMSVRAMQLHPWLCTVNKIFTADNFFFGLKQRMSPEIIATVSVGQDMRKYGQPWLENKQNVEPNKWKIDLVVRNDQTSIKENLEATKCQQPVNHIHEVNHIPGVNHLPEVNHIPENLSGKIKGFQSCLQTKEKQGMKVQPVRELSEDNTLALRPILKIKQKKNRSQNELKLLPKVKDLPSNVDSLTDPPVSRTFKIEHMIMLVNLFRFVYRIHQLAKSIPRGKLYVLDSIIEEIESYLSGLLRKYVGLHLKALKTEQNVFGINLESWKKFVGSQNWQTYRFVIKRYQEKYEELLSKDSHIQLRCTDGFNLLSKCVKLVEQNSNPQISKQRIVELLLTVSQLLPLVDRAQQKGWPVLLQSVQDINQICNHTVVVDTTTLCQHLTQLKNKLSSTLCT